MAQHSSIDHTGITGVLSAYGSNANSVSSVAAGGASTSVSRADHVHLGVTSVSHTSNTLSGPITLVAQGSIGITKQDASTFAINAVAGSGGGAADGNDLSGKELNYAQITSAVNVTATAEASADTVITGDAVVYDGSTVVKIEAFAPRIVAPNAVGGYILMVLYDGASSIGFFGMHRIPAASANNASPYYAARRLTPSAASHTYSLRAIVSAGTGVVEAGAGGAGVDVPAFMRITRA